MKRSIKRLIAIALTAVMTLGLATAATADDSTHDAHFIYTDIAEAQADLYVAKTVTSAVEGYTIPDATFTFVLKWDQDGDGTLEFAENATYFVYNEDGTQVRNENTSDGSFKTSETGRFTLEAGQYARFEWAGEVQYEVYEEKIPDGFTQTSPAGGQSASGTVSADGTYLIFENMYIPTGGGGEGDTTQLAVRKDIAWPDGYEMPDLSDVEFTFKVTIDGALYSNQPYTVYDASMTTEIDRGTTNGSGEFTITGGQLALFEEVEAGVDYQVEEVGMGTGWRAVGTTSYEGATSTPIVYAYFTDTTAGLAVEKARTDGASGTDGGEFTFTLTDEAGNAMEGVTYYLYDAAGKLVADEDGGTLRTTGEGGTFTLQAGQKAVFFGIAEGTGYKITEEADGAFKVTPEDGYAGTVDDSVSDHLFTNEELTEITITKYGSRLNTERNKLGGAEFMIYQLKEGGDPDNDEDWEPYPNADDATKTTDSTEGSETYGMLTFDNLPAGTYKIVETKTPAGYIAAGEPIEVTLPYTSENEVTGAVYSERDGVYYVYALDYTVDNTATLTMPNTGGRAWLIILLAACGCAAALISVYRYRKRHSGKEKVRA